MWLTIAISFPPTSPRLRQYRHHLPPYPLHCAATASDHSRHLQDAVTGAKMPADGRLDLLIDLRPSEPLETLLARPIQSGPDTRSDHLPFQFPEYASHLHHRLAKGAGTVDRLLVGIERHPGGIHFRHRAGDVQDAPAEPVDGPDHENLESTSYGVLEHLVKRWALVATLCARDATAIREGRRPDGSIIGPPMPIALYRGISDRDLIAMVTYLRAVPPKRNSVTQRSTYPFALESYGPPITHVADPPDNPVARGADIAGPLAHCMDCHTPVLTALQRDWTRIGAGGVPFEGPWGFVTAPNITPDRDHGGIGDWTDDQILGAIRQAVASDGRRLLPPMAARAAVYSHITDQDLRDLIAYLRSLPAQ
jgi:mono/diheme cytochrome c family protein